MTRRRILLVDDDISLTRALAMYLTEAGNCDVRIENEGTRAVATAREFEPDLIFLDVLMPDSDGGALASEIQADPRLRGTPIVFLTGLVSRSETGGTSKRIGAYPFLAKPVHPKVLLAYVQEHALGKA
jgi:CheY-like chemotaxis protein